MLNSRTSSVALRFMLFMIIAYPGLSTGSNPVDSLKNLIRENKGNPETQSILYARLAKKLLDMHNDSCYDAAITGLNIALKAQFNEGIMRNAYEAGRYLVTLDSLNLAADYLLIAKEKIRNDSDPEMKMRIYIVLGYIYDLQSKYSQSLEHYFEGLKIAESSSRDDWQQYFINNIAVVYNKVEQYQRSIDYFKRALAYFKIHGDSINYANTLVNIGVAYVNLEITDSALHYFDQTEPIQKRRNNYYGLINLYVGRGSLLQLQKNYPEAMKMFIISRKLIDSLDQRYSGSVHHLRLSTENKIASINKHLKKYNEAEVLYRNVLNLSRKENLIYYESQALNGLSEVLEATGRTDSSLKYARMYQVIFDSMNDVKEHWKLGIAELEYRQKKEQETRRLQEQKKEAQKKTEELEKVIFILSVVALVVLLSMIILLLRSRSRRLALEQANLRLEKENLIKDMELKNRELVTKSMSLAEKDELLTNVKKQLEVIMDAGDNEEDDEQLRRLIHELERQDSKNFWDEFDTHFKNVHVDFYPRLTNDFPQITPNELKLCAFLKLNLSTKQIAQITRKSEHSIKVARYRLRRKIGLEREDNLSIFFSKY